MKRRMLRWSGAGIGGGACVLLVGVLWFAGCAPTPPTTPTTNPKTDGDKAKIEGTIKIVGSDTMANLGNRWADGFKKKHPDVKVEVEGKGSGTAPDALAKNAATFGTMSREMTKEEFANCEKELKFKPTGLPCATDLIAVYVHKDNPIKSLSFLQLDGIFSKTRVTGSSEVNTWGDLGLEGEWAKQPISLYGRDNASGTAKYFKETVLKKAGDFKDTVKAQPGSSGVVDSIKADKFGIGYSGIGYKNADVRAVPLSVDGKKPAVEASEQNGRNKTYPLSRPLFLYVNHKPGTDLDPLRLAFLNYVFSDEGQKAVEEDGELPLDAADLGRALDPLR